MTPLSVGKFKWWPSVVVFILLLQTLFNEAQSFHKRESSGNEIYEIRIFETAPPGTKATLNEAFDRLMREQKNCFAQLDIALDVDWIEFDSALLMFITTAEVPSTAKITQQAILHLMCSSNKMRSIHFSIHVTRRNRHPPKFTFDTFQFYAPANLKIGNEIGRLQVLDNDPIIYNSQVQLNILPNLAAISRINKTPFHQHQTTSVLNKINDNFESNWQINKNGSLTVKNSMSNLQLYHPYNIRILAVDFGSPQLFSICNITIIPVSVSQPRNVRINVANTEYQIFEWDSPSYGIPERYKLTLRRNNLILYEESIEQSETIALSRMHFLSAPDYSVTVTAIDVDGESPSEPHKFMLIQNELNCEGECSAGGGVPLCFYGRFHKIEQYRDANGGHCLCFNGFSSSQCNVVESCPEERLVEPYGSINWPLTLVNKSSSIACPYNGNGETITRQCIWDTRLDMARWENVSNNDVCKKQSSILVHLGVLANYAQRADQTASGLRAVQRFLTTILQMPTFRVEIPEVQFDAKISEHVAQVIDTVTTMNLTAVSGNTTDVRDALVNYILEFKRRIPVPFHLQSSEGGFQIKTWHWLKASPLPQKTEGEKEGVGDEFPTQFGRRCYVHLPSRRKKTGSSEKLVIQKKSNSLSQIVRIACLRSSTILPLLDGRSPVLFASIDADDAMINETVLRKQRFEKDLTVKNKYLLEGHIVRSNDSNIRQRLVGNAKALIALRPDPTFGSSRNEINYTCAIYDHSKLGWSITGITLLSRNFEDGFVLCETTHLGIFALLPESIFEAKRMNLFQLLVAILPIASSTFAIFCTIFLLLIALIQRPRCIDPALVLFLFTFLLIHCVHLIVLVAPHITTISFSSDNDCLVYLIVQYCAIGVAALITLINVSTRARIIDLKLGVHRIVSLCCRLISTFFFGVMLPLFLCIVTWMFNGYIYYGVTTSEPSLQPFNWVFGITFMFPLVIFIASSIGYAVYSYYYATVLAQVVTPLSTHQVALLSNTSNGIVSMSPESSRHRLLRDLANSTLFSVIILALFYANAVLFYFSGGALRFVIMALVHLALSGCAFIFVGLLFRIELKFPRYARSNHISEASRSSLQNNSGSDFNLFNNVKCNGNGNYNGVGFLLNNDETDTTTRKSRLLNLAIENNENYFNQNGNVIINKSHYHNAQNQIQAFEHRNYVGDSDSGRLTINSPPPSCLNTAQQTLIHNEDSDVNARLTTRSVNVNSSPLSGLGTISTLSNNSSQIRHNLSLIKPEDVSNNNSCFIQRNEYANIRRGSQPTINAMMRSSAHTISGFYDGIQTKTNGLKTVVSPRLLRHPEFNDMQNEIFSKKQRSMSTLHYTPSTQVNYRTSAVQLQKYAEKHSESKTTPLLRAPLKLNLIYGSGIEKIESSLSTSQPVPLFKSAAQLAENDCKWVENVSYHNSNDCSQEIILESDDLSSCTSSIKEQQFTKTSDIVKKLFFNNSNEISYSINLPVDMNDNIIDRKARFDHDRSDSTIQDEIEDDNEILLSHPVVSVV